MLDQFLSSNVLATAEFECITNYMAMGGLTQDSAFFFFFFVFFKLLLCCFISSLILLWMVV